MGINTQIPPLDPRLKIRDMINVGLINFNTSKQFTLFGKVPKQKSKKFIVYRTPRGTYDSFIERCCLRTKTDNVHFDKHTTVENAQEG